MATFFRVYNNFVPNQFVLYASIGDGICTPSAQNKDYNLK